MLPVIHFAAGVVAGAVALRLMKHEKTSAGLAGVQSRLRQATASSLSAVEQVSARVRERLVPGGPEDVPEDVFEDVSEVDNTADPTSPQE